jgi:hypothetical protein
MQAAAMPVKDDRDDFGGRAFCTAHKSAPVLPRASIAGVMNQAIKIYTFGYPFVENRLFSGGLPI